MAFKHFGTTTGRMQGKSLLPNLWTPQQLSQLQNLARPKLGEGYEPVYTRKGLLQLDTDIIGFGFNMFRLQVSVHASAVVSGPGKTITQGQAARMIKVREEMMEVPSSTSRANQKQLLETMCEIVAVRLDRGYRLVNPITTKEPQVVKLEGRATPVVVHDEIIMDDLVDVDMADLEKRIAAYCAEDGAFTKQLFTGATTWHLKT
jgi:hypothetical protein